jgi:glucose-1-phosphate cytidylyltransferase
MKTVILAGGLGTRLGEETSVRPKPMVEIGGLPILWHIMKIYSHAQFHDFVICLGYKGYVIKEYFSNYLLHQNDIVIDFANGGRTEFQQQRTEPWRVALIDTGDDSQTGGRLKRVQKYVSDETFFCTYGDGVADIDLQRLLAFHRSHGKLVTVTAVRPAGRFGALTLDGDTVDGFVEKPLGDGGWINGGFFVMEPAVMDYLGDDKTVLEADCLTKLAAEGQLKAFKHEGFWHAMDTLRDKNHLSRLWSERNAPWRIWN